MGIEEFSLLDNGVKMIFSPIRSHVSHIGLFINAGSRDEDATTQGGMHMIEHMLFKGTKKRTYLELLDCVESVGGDINAYTSKEETCVYVSIQNEFLERAIDVLADIFYGSEFQESELEKEKEVVLDEIESYKDSPQEYIYDEFEEKLFAPHELSWNILGTEKSVKTLNSTKLRKLYNKHYVNNNIIISYAGGVSCKKVTSLLKKHFNCAKQDTTQYIEKSICTLHNTFSETIRRETFQAHCIIGTKAPSMHSNFKVSMVLLNNLLGGSCFNSQLNLLLREQHGLTYNIESNYTAYSDTGIFTIYFGTDNTKLQQCKDLIFEKCNELISVGLSHDMLHMYKQQLIGQIALSFDNHVSYMISNAKSYMNYEKVDTYQEIIEKINNIKHEHIQELAVSVLSPNSFSILEYV